jgi:hypothetical protein
VRVHASSYSPSLISSSAFTSEGDIFFRGECPADDLVGQFLLAHEMAHVLQVRAAKNGARNRPAGSICQIEAEASLAALAFVAGLPCCALSAAPPDATYTWGPVGHFYTVYYIALAAGFVGDDAFKLAFYTQLCDQLWELDAVDVIGNWLTRYYELKEEASFLRNESRGNPWFSGGYVRRRSYELQNVAPPGMHYWSRESWLQRYGKTTRDYMIYPLDYAVAIQRGLHCLTGDDSKSETQRRKERLEAGNISKPAIYGLHIHAFGDSFAHRRIGDEGCLYSTGLGHAVEGVNVVYGNEMAKLYHLTKNSFMSWATWVDNIANRPWLYIDYGEGLYEVLRKKNSNKEGTPLPRLLKDLEGASSIADQDGQREFLKARTREILSNGTLHSYCPAEKTVSFQGWSEKDLPPFGTVDLGNAATLAAALAKWIPLRYRFPMSALSE